MEQQAFSEFHVTGFVLSKSGRSLQSLPLFLSKSIVVFSLLFLSLTARSQPAAKDLTLQSAIKAAIDSNRNVAIAVMDEEIATSKYKQTQAVFLPQVCMSYSAMVTNNPLNAFGFKLQQQSIAAKDFDPYLLNHPDATPDFMTRVEVQQPLVNMDRLYERKSALKQSELYQYKTQRTREFISLQVQQAYLQLQLAYEGKKVLDESLKTVNAIHKFTSDRYNQGLLQKSDLLNVEVQSKSIESNIAEAESNIKNASDNLSLLMNLPTGIIYKTDAFADAVTNIPLTDSLPANRSDFKAMEIAIQSYDLAIKSTRKSNLPRLNAFANYQLNDKNMFGFGSNAYMAGLQLSWDVFKGNQSKNNINTQTLEQQKMVSELAKQKEEGDLDLQKTQRQLADAAFKISQQKQAVQLADEALRILQNRYSQGLVNTTDVLTAQTQLSQQKLMYQQAIYASNVTGAYLQYLTTK
ncbi:TolC family protein [soil metagenome]